MQLENVKDIYPLSPMQHLMLMQSLQSAEPSTLVNQFRFHLRGPLDQTRFTSAWEKVFKRHDALRTAFLWQDIPEPLQVVRAEVELPLKFVDLRGETETARSNRIETLLREDRDRNFDLRQAPLLRLLVVHLADDEHLLILSRHHLILDLWSAEIIFNEVHRAYEAPEELIDSAVGNFRTYLEWLLQQDSASAETYWRKYLESTEAPTLLFKSHIQRARRDHFGQPSVVRSIDAEVASKVAAIARQAGVTPGSLLQGLIALVVSELTGKRDVIFGLTVSTRTQQVENIEQIVGSFTNNVPARFQISDEQPLRQWLESINLDQSQRAAFSHVSPVDLHRWSGATANTVLFDLLVLIQPPSQGRRNFGLLTIEPMAGPVDTALPMTLAFEVGPEGYRLTGVYEPAIVSEDEAEAILETLSAAIFLAAEGLPEQVGQLRLSIAESISNRPCLTALKDRPNIANVTVPADCGATPSAPGAKMLDIFRRALGNPDVGLDDDFFALGGTSIQAAIAFSEIERLFDRTLPLSTLFSAGSARGVLEHLDLPPAPSSSLVSIQGSGKRPPIVTVSGIGGEVIGLSDIARVLGEEQPLFGLQPKVLESGEIPADSIEAIAKDYVEECEEVLRGPFVLFGICFGANVVIEMAQQLAERNKAPALVVVLDPSVDDSGENTGEVAAKAFTTFGFVAERARLMFDTYRSMQGEERRHWLRNKRDVLIRKIRHRDLLHGNHLEFRQRRLEAANIAAAQRYCPRFYGGEIRAMITRDRPIDAGADPRTAWLKLMERETSLVDIPGRDTGDAVNNHSPAIAELLKEWVDELISERGLDSH